VKFAAGIDWSCPSWGINWHRCYGYIGFNFWPFWVNVEYSEGFENENGTP
jgi:hypothetical protein